MDKVVLFIQFLWMLLSHVGGRNIFYERPFCGFQPLHEIFTKYNCTPHDSDGNTYAPNENKSGITECCESPCTEYYIITRYCRYSNISQYVNKSEPGNQIFREANVTLKFKSNKIVQENSSQEKERNPSENKVRKGKKMPGKKLKRKSHSQERFRSLGGLLRKGVANGKIRKSCECRCRKRRAKINHFQYKPAVVVIKQTNTPVPIPIRRNFTRYNITYKYINTL